MTDEVTTAKRVRFDQPCDTSAPPTEPYHIAGQEAENGVYFSAGPPPSVLETAPPQPAAGPSRGSWSVYWKALRPWSFTASVTPVILGAALAYRTTGGQCDCLIFFSSLLTALSVHAAGNLVNTYFDYSLGFDSNRRWCDDRTLVDQLLTCSEVEVMATVLYALGTGAFVTTVIAAGGRAAFVLTLIFVLGMSGSFFYTGGGPLALKYRALGELLVFTVFGPVTVTFAFFAQLVASPTEVDLSRWVWPPLLYALPMAINTVAILHANNLRDAASERERGRLVTVAIILGPFLSRLVLTALLLLPYVVCAVLALHSAVAFLLPLLSAGEALALVRVAASARTGRETALRDLPQRIARLNLLLGVLYVLSVLLAPGHVFENLV